MVCVPQTVILPGLAAYNKYSTSRLLRSPSYDLQCYGLVPSTTARNLTSSRQRVLLRSLEMGFFERAVWKLSNTPDPFVDKSPKPLATPSQIPIPTFTLPSGESSTCSSTTSISSASSFWRSPAPPRWSVRYTPASVRNNVSKRQVVVVVCLLLALLVWSLPQPRTWNRQVVHIAVQQPGSNPYHVLRPASQTTVVKRHAPNPVKWLEHNSNNRHADNHNMGLLKSVPSLGHHSAKPKAALISLVRNLELPGLMQSMRQLEYQWNRKYNYPWIFFNDEPFTEEFRVRNYFPVNNVHR